MKFWWPQNEAIIAALLAYQLTGDAKVRQDARARPRLRLRVVPDPEFGDWFGYFHRDGRLSSPSKAASTKAASTSRASS